MDKSEEEGKLGHNCFENSPDFGLGVKENAFKDLDSLKDKSCEEIGADFNLTKPPINTCDNNKLEFTPEIEQDIKLESDEILEGVENFALSKWFKGSN